MLRTWITASWLLLAGLTCTGLAAERIDLKVLYAGNPGSERAKDFTRFLREHFEEVGEANTAEFTDKSAEGYDVAILDWTSIYPRDERGEIIQNSNFGLKQPQMPRLSPSFSRPVVMIGAIAGQVGPKQQTKIDWLCLCLNEAAHGMRTDHELFHKPYAIDIQLEDRATPPNYRQYPEGESLGSTMKVWKVQNVLFPKVDPGLVSSPWGFEDSPDAEVISSGLNAKGPASVAIGRHGNYLLWGFSAQPSDMTPQAARCFVNAVCYIRKFNGPPLVRKTAPSRDTGLLHASHLKHYGRDAAQAERLIGYWFPAELRSKFGTDAGKYEAYYRDNLEYLRPGEDAKERFMLIADEDAAALKTSNRKIESLERWIGMLADNDQRERALRLLKRYTTESFDHAAEWRAWLDENRDRLFFTDVGGFKFMVNPQAQAATAGAAAR